MATVAPGYDYQAAASAFNPTGDALAASQNLAQMRQIAAQHLAGQQIAGGNYQQGTNTLYGSGDIKDAQQEQQFGGTTAGASALAARNYPAAGAAFGSAGDVANVQNAQAGQFQQFQMLGSYLKQASPVLNAAYQQGGAPGLAHAVGMTTQELVQAGLMTPQQAQQRTMQAASDPQGLLSDVGNFVQQTTYQKVGGSNTLLGTNAMGTPLTMVNGQTTATLNNPNGSQNLVATAPTIQSVGGGQGTPQPAAATTQPAAPSVTSAPGVGAAPLNNPGNLRPVGATTGFMQYSTPQAGLVALSDDLGAKAKDGITTLSALANKYAPQGENNTSAWMQTVGTTSGITDPNAKIDLSNPNTRAAIMAGIVKAEGSAGTQLGGAAPSPAPSGGASVLASTNNGAPANRMGTPAENQALGGGIWQQDAKGAWTQITKPGDIDQQTPEDIARGATNLLLQGPAQQTQGTVRGQGEIDAQMKQTALARQWDVQDGVSAGERLQRQNNYANAKTTLNTMYPLYQSMKSYESATLGDFKNVQDAIEQLGPTTSIKSVNDLLNVARKQLNSTDYNKLQVSLKDAQSNYNKLVLGSGTGSGGAPGSAGEREENEDLFPDGATIPVMLGNIAQAQLGMNNRMQGIAGQIADQHDAMMTGIPGIPHSMIAYLQTHPNTADQFNAQFGAGASRTILNQ